MSKTPVYFIILYLAIPSGLLGWGERTLKLDSKSWKVIFILKARLKITYPNGDTFEGYYDEEKKKQGFGIYTWKFTPNEEDEEEPVDEEEEENENRKRKIYPHFEGNFVNNQKSGKGVLYTKEGEMYYGFWEKDLFNGRGVYKYKNGDIYDGYWVNGMKEGEGTYCVAVNGNKVRFFLNNSYKELGSRTVQFKENGSLKMGLTTKGNLKTTNLTKQE